MIFLNFIFYKMFINKKKKKAKHLIFNTKDTHKKYQVNVSIFKSSNWEKEMPRYKYSGQPIERLTSHTILLDKHTRGLEFNAFLCYTKLI